MGASKNLPTPLNKWSEGHHWLLMMSSELSHRLVNAREEKSGLWPKTISLFVAKGMFAFGFQVDDRVLNNCQDGKTRGANSVLSLSIERSHQNMSAQSQISYGRSSLGARSKLRSLWDLLMSASRFMGSK